MRSVLPLRRKIQLVLALALVIMGCAKPSAGVVSLENGAFVENGRPFFPLAINTIVHLEFNDTHCWAAPMVDPHRADHLHFSTRDSALLLLKAEFELMRNMGFNTVRIVGLASDLVVPEGSADLCLKVKLHSGQDTLFALNGSRSEEYLDAVEEVVALAEQSGLKLIMLVKLVPGQPAYEDQLAKLADRLRDHQGILAYDFFNEPLYFDIHDRPKQEVHEVVKRWQKLLKAHAPHQLTTIGLVGVPEVFAWDPNVLDVDFISFHPYEYEPNQVINEIRWYGQQVDKPWIIGETSLPADNDSVPYADQLAFARKTLAQTRACGGVGYSWWQFKDVKWGRFHADYMGVLSQSGWTDVGPGLPRVEGTVKPVVEAFKEFDPKAPMGACEQPDNYYNFSSLHGAVLTGKLLDQDRKPIEGGVILGWNENWTRSYYTKSKADGSFALYGDFRFHHWMVSATRYSMERGDCAPNAFFTGADSVSGHYLGELVLQHVDYANGPERR